VTFRPFLVNAIKQIFDFLFEPDHIFKQFPTHAFVKSNTSLYSTAKHVKAEEKTAKEWLKGIQNSVSTHSVQKHTQSSYHFKERLHPQSENFLNSLHIQNLAATFGFIYSIAELLCRAKCRGANRYG
jgi:hypothetical protein